MNTPLTTTPKRRKPTSTQRAAAELRNASLTLLVSATTLFGGASQASSPVEKVVCTQAPRNTWMSEQQARAAFKADNHVLVRFKISKGNCHEFYAIDRDGGVTEAYLHPVSGATVRSTHIPASLSPAGSPTRPTSASTPSTVPAEHSSSAPVIRSSF